MTGGVLANSVAFASFSDILSCLFANLYRAEHLQVELAINISKLHMTKLLIKVSIFKKGVVYYMYLFCVNCLKNALLKFQVEFECTPPDNREFVLQLS